MTLMVVGVVIMMAVVVSLGFDGRFVALAGGRKLCFNRY